MTKKDSTPRKSFGEVLAMMARLNPKGIAVTYGPTNISWKELNERVNRLANALKLLGVKKGDHASILFHDCPEFIEANYALQKIGAVPIPINFRFVAREIAYQLKNSDSSILIFEDLYLAETAKALKDAPGIKQVVCLARDERSMPAGMTDYLSLIRTGETIEPPPCTTEDDVCTICYTGGTTGLPKGVVLTYSNFWNLARSLFGDLLGRLASDTKVNFGRIVSRLLPVPGLEKGLNRLMGSTAVRSFLSDALPKLISDTAGTAIGPILGRVTGGISMFMNMPLFHMAN
ncbi:MAG TPA: AMP-binding protein, partial [Deltaproteobacteria bacterium]|nr:AMP-binding protein [Deltaproteobacteria bacterium]